MKFSASRSLYFHACLAASLLGGAAVARADAFQSGTPTQYTITLKKVELCAAGSTVSNCVSPYVIGTGTQTYDIASYTPGASAGDYTNIDPATWPVGTTFTYMRATLARTHTIKASFPVADNGGSHPTSGSCSTRAGSGSVNTLAAAADDSDASTASSTTIYELNGTDGSPATNPDFGHTTSELAQGGITLLDNDTYTNIIPLTQSYTAVQTLPTVKVSFDMQQSVTAFWLDDRDCAGNSSGSPHCCFGTGPTGVSITFQ